MALSYHPIFFEMNASSGQASGTALSKVVLLLYAFALIISLDISCLRRKLFQVFLICVMLGAIVAVFINAVYGNDTMFSKIKDLLMCFGGMMIGWCLAPKHKQLKLLLIVSSATMFFVGLMQVMTNIGGFVIEDLYLTNAKNSVGAMLATGVVMQSCLFFAEENKILRIIELILLIFGIVLILTIRARAALLSSILLLVLMVFKSSNGKHVFKKLMIISIAAVLFFFFAPDFVMEYINDSFTSGQQGDDITSGRVYTYADALKFLFSGGNLLEGNVQGYHILNGWVHNYLLGQVYNYGLLYALPMVVLYLYLIVFLIKRFLKANVKTIFSCGYIVILVLVITSLLEPTFPFSPGTVSVESFILLGVSIRSRTLIKD